MGKRSESAMQQTMHRYPYLIGLLIFAILTGIT